MAEYIEKQAALKEVCDACGIVPDREKENCKYKFAGCKEYYNVFVLPPADVRPVRRGRWEMDSDGIPHCTECGYVAPQRLFLQVQSLACTTQFIMSNYCPDCGSYNGADMMGESEGGKG